MIRNSKGSTILWAITIIMVLMITIAGGLTISYSYFQRSIQNNNKRQAYLTAKGIIENIVEFGYKVPQILIKGLDIANKAINKKEDD